MAGLSDPAIEPTTSYLQGRFSNNLSAYPVLLTGILIILSGSRGMQMYVSFLN